MKEEIEREAEKFENETPYVAWINSSIYPDGKIYTKDFTEYLFQKLKERDEKIKELKKDEKIAFDCMIEKDGKLLDAQTEIQSLSKKVEEQKKVIQVVKEYFGSEENYNQYIKIHEFLSNLNTEV